MLTKRKDNPILLKSLDKEDIDIKYLLLPSRTFKESICQVFIAKMLLVNFLSTTQINLHVVHLSEWHDFQSLSFKCRHSRMYFYWKSIASKFSIHQPNYFTWLSGLNDMIFQVRIKTKILWSKSENKQSIWK